MDENFTNLTTAKSVMNPLPDVINRDNMLYDITAQLRLSFNHVYLKNLEEKKKVI